MNIKVIVDVTLLPGMIIAGEGVIVALGPISVTVQDWLPSMTYCKVKAGFEPPPPASWFQVI